RGLFLELAERSATREEAASLFAPIRVGPVLTAHPTEVQRKSTLDAQLAIASELGVLDATDLLPEERQACETELRRLVSTLWQTRLLGPVNLGVRDEIENALAYFSYTFIDALPRLQVDVEDSILRLPGTAERPDLAPLVAIGSWVGGDRDGNPFVTAEMLEH